MVAGTRCWGRKSLSHLLAVEVWNKGAARKGLTDMSREESWNEQHYKNKLIWGPQYLRTDVFLAKPITYGNFILSQFLKLFLKEQTYTTCGWMYGAMWKRGEAEKQNEKMKLAKWSQLIFFIPQCQIIFHFPFLEFIYTLILRSQKSLND